MRAFFLYANGDARKQATSTSIIVNHRSASNPVSARTPLYKLLTCRVGLYVADWAARDGLTWLYLLKTVIAASLALGIAMLLELPSPRTAMVTVFVLMQPMHGMVLAKSFYRVLGTAAGMVAAIVLGALFPQQPELYLAAIALWSAVCTALATRFRHYRWYAFVLAGYTAVIIGIPVVQHPDGLLLAALTRAADVSLGILCSGAISALVFPARSSAALLRSVRQRKIDLTAFCADVLALRCDNETFGRRFEKLVDGIAGFEAARTFASFEGSSMRVRVRRIALIDSKFATVCTRLHMVHQLIRRLQATRSMCVLKAITPLFADLSIVLDRLHARLLDAQARSDVIAQITRLQASLSRRIDELRSTEVGRAPVARIEQYTAFESVHRLVADLLEYLETDESAAGQSDQREQSNTYQSRTSFYVTALTFVRTALTVGAAGAYWVATAWPSGSLAVIAAAIVAGLTSASARPERLALQIAAGAACGVAIGYAYLCFIYPNIDGFPLLCAALAPVIACGALLASRPGTSGYGIGLCVFFCLLAVPDNVVVYTPNILLNNGVAVVVTLLLSAATFAVAFPLQAPWVVERILRDLRREVAVACDGPYDGVAQRFQSRTHDLLSQLRMLLTPGSTRYANAWRWMLATLEMGYLVIALRGDLPEGEVSGTRDTARWMTAIDLMNRRMANLFDYPDEHRYLRACRTFERGLKRVSIEIEHAEREGDRVRLYRIASQLCVIRSALLDGDAPFQLTGQ
ncbi:FUSC family protein [Paraburkholderia sp. LEh10]|uniref:FUSC family protein n=1 Tax=Paraburkholderia sp. LEh10 TaxID=2821353 RepID=UPI001AE384B0|nr:FUSC family protein [Paraburkholderia sp. LEh10]MBP0594093.1 FUSC family protein [Paraburkholderia sp. LEh10]